MSRKKRSEFVRMGLAAALIMTLVALVSPVGLIQVRGHMLRGLVGTYSTVVASAGQAIDPPSIYAASGALPNTIVSISANWNSVELDQVSPPTDGFPDGNVPDTTVAAWDDGGAGGAFGYIDPNTNQFVASSDPTLITSYRTPNSSSESWVTLTFTVSNPPGTRTTTDPVTGQTVQLYNDPPVSTSVTVDVAPLPPDYITASDPSNGGQFNAGDSIPVDGQWVGLVGSTYFQQVWLTPAGSSQSLYGQTNSAVNQTPPTTIQSWGLTSFSTMTAGSYYFEADLIRQDADGTQELRSSDATVCNVGSSCTVVTPPPACGPID